VNKHASRQADEVANLRARSLANEMVAGICDRGASAI